MISTDIRQQTYELIEESLSQLSLPEKPTSLYDPVRYTLSIGGKRIRPYFTLIGCGLCSGDIEEAVPAAVSIELLHNFTLLHDDIMDAAPTRRGAESVYKKWNNSVAILSGDTMYAWAFEQLQYYGKHEKFTKEQYFNILNIFLDSAKMVCEGQAYDLDYEEVSDLDMESYLTMIRGKTAALISGAFMLGGKVANASDKELRLLDKIGELIGIGFQVQDDLLDIEADPEAFGKQTAGDITEGKKTYLFILALQHCNKEQKEELISLYNKNELTQKEVQQVIGLFKDLNILTMAREAVKSYYDRGIEHIEMFADSSYKQDLIEFIINLKNRKY